MRWVHAERWLLLVAWLAGCGGRSTRPGTDAAAADAAPPTLTETELAQAFADGICDAIAGCCEARAFNYQAASCKRNGRAMYDKLFSHQLTPNIAYDPSAARACLDAYTSALGRCPDALDRSALDQICNGIFVGQLPAGAPCSQSAECAVPPQGSAACSTLTDPNASPPSLSGTCAVFPPGRRGTVGEACQGNCPDLSGDTVCAMSDLSLCYQSDGLYCSNTRQVCVRFAELGVACEAGGCTSGSYCAGGFCSERTATGSCAGAGDEACAAESYCDPTAELCAPKLPAGGACLSMSACRSGSCAFSISGAGACDPGAVINQYLCDGFLN